MLDVDQLHAQVSLADHLATAQELVPLLPVDVVPLAGVVVVGQPQNLPDALVAFQVGGRPLAGRAEDFAPFDAAAAADDDRRAAEELLRAAGGELGHQPHQSVTDDVAVGRSFGGKSAPVFTFEFGF